MTLGKRIKSCRQNAGMSQEKVASLLGISRQAVTKWEADQSTPNTENLFKLAEIFGTTVDLLLHSGESTELSAAEQMYRLYKFEEKQKCIQKRKKRKKNATVAFITAAAYLSIYLMGRFLWCSSPESSFLGWLTGTTPSGDNSYLYGWLLSSNLFWISMAISAIPALFGKRRFSYITLAAFAAGLLLGILLGPNPAGIPYGQDHYGWAIWGTVYLLSVIAGILAERLIPHSSPVADAEPS